MSSVNNEYLGGLRKFFDEVTSHVRSLVNLAVERRTYGSLLCPITFEKLPNELRLIINRNDNENNWNFTKILDLINVELKAREGGFLPSHSATEGKNDFGFSSPSYTPYTGSSLVSGSSSLHRQNRKFRKWVSKGYSIEGSGKKYVFCDGGHWSDKCRIVSNVQARKDLLKNENRCFMCLKTDHTSGNC